MARKACHTVPRYHLLSLFLALSRPPPTLTNLFPAVCLALVSLSWNMSSLKRVRDVLLF